MKYMFMSLVALLLAFSIGGLLTTIIKRKKPKLRFRGSTAIGTISFGLLIILIAMFGYLRIYYHADETALQAIDSSTDVQVTKINKGYYFDGQGEDTALIFYPGAKVEGIAYAPLLLELAENGVDCFLAEMPLNMAIFGVSYGEEFINQYDYENWYMAGHSMGGMMAANFTVDRVDSIDGLVLLAAYSMADIDDSVSLLSIYGDQDEVLTMSAYHEYMDNWPSDSVEYVIKGGNHSGFAYYGPQQGDGIAKISKDEQIAQTAEAILELIMKGYKSKESP